MLVRFIVSNFLSFKEEQEINMLASSLKTHKHHVYENGKVKLLKSAAIYGANGAGKSNLIKAIEFLQDTIREGGVTKSINDKKFRLDESYESKPSFFEIEVALNNKLYSYGVSFHNSNIEEEWLYESGVTKEDRLIFEHKKSKKKKPLIKVANKYQKTQKQKLLIELMEENLLKQGELFLGKSTELKIKEISDIRKAIEQNIIIIHPGSKFQGLVPNLTLSDKFKVFANELLKTFDTGVEELGIEEIDFEKFFGDDDEEIKKEIKENIDNGDSVIYNIDGGGVLITKENNRIIVKKVIANHFDSKGNKVSFDLNEESDGTQRLLDFIPAFNGILEDDVTFLIDEIDQSLHPTLLKALIKKVMDDYRTRGQLIFTTHESNLLDFEFFRQDEIWFVEKERNSNSSKLYSLSEYKPRYDLDIRKGYLKGRFGAIPFLAHLEELNWHEEDA